MKCKYYTWDGVQLLKQSAIESYVSGVKLLMFNLRTEMDNRVVGGETV